MSFSCSKLNKYIVAVCFANLTLLGFGQATNLSPYSRYGIGEITPSGFAFQNGMGGVGQAIRDGIRLNPTNPASYSAFGNTAFELGLKSQFLNLQSESESQLLNNTNLNYVAVGLALSKKWGFAFGLLPYSSIGYNITTSEPIPDQSGTITNNYIGNGGINRVFVGSAYEIVNKKDSIVLSVGANAFYNFGSITRIRKAFFPGTPGFLNPQVRDEATVSDWSFETGAQFSFYPNKKKDLKVIIGATYGFEADLNASQQQFAFTFTRNASGVEQVRDTVSLTRDENGSYKIPTKLSLGAGIVLKQKLHLAFEYSSQNWQSASVTFSGNEQSLDLVNSSVIALGGMYVPYADNPFVSEFWKRVDYTFGLRYEETNLNLRNNQINDLGISFGIGVPVRRSASTSRISFNVQAGQRGTTNNNLIREQYVNIFLGLTLTPHRAADRWFVKRRYD